VLCEGDQNASTLPRLPLLAMKCKLQCKVSASQLICLSFYQHIPISFSLFLSAYTHLSLALFGLQLLLICHTNFFSTFLCNCSSSSSEEVTCSCYRTSHSHSLPPSLFCPPSIHLFHSALFPSLSLVFGKLFAATPCHLSRHWSAAPCSFNCFRFLFAAFSQVAPQKYEKVSQKFSAAL